MFVDLLAALKLLRSPEVCALVEDLGLDFPDSFQSCSHRESLRLGFHLFDPFQEERESYKRVSYPGLLDMYAKHNSKGKSRSFGCDVSKELTLF